MLYVSIDELEHIVYHDAEVVNIKMKDQCMTWMTKSINVTTDNTQNSYPNDMCVADAEIVFESFEIKSLIFSEKGTFDANNNYIRTATQREASPSKYASILSKSTIEYCWIQGMHMVEVPADGKHRFAADFSIVTDDDVFDILLEYDHVVISWDAFNGNAWYVDNPRKKQLDS